MAVEPFQSLSARGVLFRHNNPDGECSGFNVGPLDLDIARGEIVYFWGCIAHALYAPLVRRFNRGEPPADPTFIVQASMASDNLPPPPPPAP